MLSVVIVDDEAAARARLRRLLSEEPDVQVVLECENGKDAVNAILDRAPNLVFLDIEMPELNGFEVLRALPKETIPAFVFVTAFNYALDAFAVDALDYLLKPFDAERFQVTMRRARERIHARGDQDELLTAIREISETQREIRAAVAQLPEARGVATRQAFLERIAIKADGRVFFVRVEEVDYIESAANYVKVRVGNETHLIRERLGELAARLDPTRFARIHRSTIVNLDRIKEIQPWFSGDALVILKTGQKLRLSRMFRASLELGTRSRL